MGYSVLCQKREGHMMKCTTGERNERRVKPCCDIRKEEKMSLLSESKSGRIM